MTNIAAQTRVGHVFIHYRTLPSSGCFSPVVGTKQLGAIWYFRNIFIMLILSFQLSDKNKFL